jgi:HK97 family phage prohead protease
MKDKNKIQTRFVQVRQNGVDLEKRTAEFVISTEAVDSYGTVFLADGWDFTRYNQNPVVFYQHGSHSADPDALVGVSSLRQEGKDTIAKVTFEPEDINPLAEKVLRKLHHGTLRGASIGADIKQGRWGKKDAGEDPDVIYFERQELLEWSIVTIPSNPAALKRNAEDLDALKASLAPVTAEVVAPENRESGLDEFEAQYMYNKNKV